MNKWIRPQPTDRLLAVTCSAVCFAAIGFIPVVGPWLDMIRLLAGEPTRSDLGSLAFLTLCFAGIAGCMGAQLERILVAYGIRLSRLPDQGRDFRELDQPTPPDDP